MKRRAIIGLMLGSLATVVVRGYACGPGQASTQLSVVPSPSGSAVAQNSPPGGPAVISFVVRPGADPMIVGRRIAGPGASVSPGYPERRPRENLPMTVLLRTFIVTVPPDQEMAVLKQAQADPDVQSAYVGSPCGG